MLSSSPMRHAANATVAEATVTRNNGTQQHDAAWHEGESSFADEDKMTDSASDSMPENSAPQSSLRSSPTSLFAQTVGLHQRPRHGRHPPDDDGSYRDDHNYYYQSDFNNSAHRRAYDESPDNKYGKQRHAVPQPKRRRAICGARTQSILLALALAYLALAIHMYRKVVSNDEYFYRDPRDSERLLELVNQMEKLRIARSFLDERESIARRNGRNLLVERKATRSRRIQIPALETNDSRSSVNLLGQVDSAQWLSDKGLEVGQESNEESASLETLCGFHAQNASLSFPQNYAMRDAVGPRSRVLITGITDTLGIRLAMLLRQRCHANVVAAIDPTFPNTIPTRMRLMETLQQLAHHIPKLNLIHGHMGLDPLKREQFVLMNSTGEVDLVRTFQPTHIVHLANFFQTTDFNHEQHPYVKIAGDAYVPSLYQIRSTLVAMEQILLSIASTDEKSRPHFIYASSGSTSSADAEKDSILKSETLRMQEIMASTYHSLFDVQSTAIRLPEVIFGPWHSEQSCLHRILTNVSGEHSSISASFARSREFLFADDAAEALIAAMQFRTSSPLPLVLQPTSTASWLFIEKLLKSLVRPNVSLKVGELPAQSIASSLETGFRTNSYLSWFPKVTMSEGLAHTLAWFYQQKGSLGSADRSMMDRILDQFALPSCTLNDPACDLGSINHPCASECSYSSHCSPSIFDSLIDITHDVTDGCEIVLYTQLLFRDASEFKLHTEYMDEGIPLICTVAFVAFESPLVQSVIQKVPDHEQVELGVVPRPEDLGSQEALHSLKRHKLNGRLLYQGWILVWPEEVPEILPHSSNFLLKLSPGRLFSESVKQAVFIEESFGVSPKHDDIKFLVKQLKRDALPKRTVKKKTPPKTKIRLPAEPARRAVILLAELRQQDSATTEVTVKDKISIREASRFMRFENGEHTIGKEPSPIKTHRDFYERMVSFVNRNTMRSPLEPQYTFALKHWARTRWVAHDLEVEEGRQLRCDWYKEHALWDGSTLDQLSFAYVMAKQELQRRLNTEVELNDRGLKAVADWTEIKRLLTDVFEWHALPTEGNKDYTPYGELTALPYDHVDSEEGFVDGSELAGEVPLLFARIISDRTMNTARDEWYRASKKPSVK